MPYRACNLASLLTLTLTLLVASANGFNVLRKTRRLTRMGTSETVSESPETSKFGIILDAGSSGTKVNVYKLDLDSSQSSGLSVGVTELSTGQLKVTPALHTYGDKLTTELKDYFTRIFDGLSSTRACTQLPPLQTVLYLFATAGLRDLRDSDSEKAKSLLQYVTRILSDKQVNPFKFTENNVKILSGEMEGAYSWMAVNYLNEFFSGAMSRDDSVGLLEMGGSSLQLAYMPLTPSGAGCTVEVTSEQPATLHVDSYAGLGANGVNRQVMDSLCDGGTEVENPCMLTGDSVNITCNGDQKLVVHGTGSPNSCEGILRHIVDKVNQAAAGDMPFYAIGAIPYSAERLQAVDDDSSILNITTLKRQAKMYFQMTWEYATVFKNSTEWVSNVCALGLFIPELLKKLGLEDNPIQVVQGIKNATITWALGAALDLMTPDITVSCKVTNRKKEEMSSL